MECMLQTLPIQNICLIVNIIEIFIGKGYDRLSRFKITPIYLMKSTHFIQINVFYTDKRILYRQTYFIQINVFYTDKRILYR